MNKTDWYENRIRWRLKKLQLDAFNWSDFELSNKLAAKKVVEKIEACGAPILIFWSNDDVWTLLTNQFLIGKLGDVFSIIDLDKLGPISTENVNHVATEELKKEAEYILAGDVLFWTPKGGPHFSLRNILQMFPINVP